MNITKEQIRRFWEWCGFELKVANRAWCWYLDGKLVHCGYAPCYIPLTLDNIYKYAVTKMQQKGYVVTLRAYECSGYSCIIASTIKDDWEKICKQGDNPIEALFNAIYEVIENENK